MKNLSNNKNISVTLGKGIDNIGNMLTNQSATLEVGYFQPGMARIAFWNEYGTDRNKGSIPPRPFMQNAVDKDENKWNKSFARLLPAKNYDVYATMSALGDVVVGSIKDSMVNGGYVPNARSTIKKKGEGKAPLFDTGLMQTLVTYQVTK